MENKWKRLLSILLVLCMAASCLPVRVRAAEAVPVTVEETVSPDTELPSNEELFALYAEQVLYGYRMSFLGTAAGDKLTGDEKLAYDALKPIIAQIASGQRASTAISLGFGSYSVNVGGTIETWTPEITVNFTEAYDDFDYAAVTDALLSDCPFEMYWFDKTVVSQHMSLQTQQLCYFEFRFRVADAYSAGDLLTDTAKTGAAAAAAANAKAVVAANAEKSDYERLAAYRNYICDAVSYNHGAADDDSTPYGDPWQLIYVFDGDSATNVVCEGYAKAFQYLCDLDGGLKCTRVSGYMQGATGAGRHSWNVVTLDGKNYLVDVTNCDAGTIGYPNLLFLVGAAYDGAAYTFDCNGYDVVFTCDDLELAVENYEPAAPTYTVTVNTVENGSVTANPTSAREGDTVTLTVTPADDYELDSLSVKCGQTDVEVADNKFTMPGGDVTVTAIFKLSDDLITNATALASFEYTLDETAKTITLSKYIGTDTEVTVPKYYMVEGVMYSTLLQSETVFTGNTTITSVTVGSGVGFAENTMYKLFEGCTNLAAVDMTGVDTSQVTSMRELFSLCKNLASIRGYESWDTGSVVDMYKAFNYVYYNPVRTGTLESAVIDISGWDLDQVKNTGWCFQQCYATEVLLPDNLAVISAGFFNHTARVAGSTYTIPAGVKKIGYAHTIYDFATNDFVEFIVAEGNTNYKTIDGILYSMDGTEMLAIPRNKPFENGVYEIPEGVTFLGELSFSRNYNIQKLILPDSYVIEQNVEINDEDYIVFEDRGNINNGNSLSIAVYCYTGITDYEVKDTNPNYTSIDGILYSKDLTQVVAIPTRYGRIIDIPEGVTTWNKQAMWDDKEVADQYADTVVDELLGATGGVKIPASLVSIEEEQLGMINRLKTKYQDDFVITVDDANPAYCVDENGMLGKKPQLPEVKWTANANLGSSLTLYLAFSIADLEDTTGCHAVLTRTYADETVDDVVTIQSDKWKTMTLEGVKYFYVSYSGLAAKEMTDDIHIQIFNAEGKAISQVHTDSLRGFAMRKLNGYSEKNYNSTIYAQMLLYGSAAQKYFGYNEDNLADAQLTEIQKSYGVENLNYKTQNNAVIGENYAASNLQLQSTIKLYLKFNEISDASYAIVSFVNHQGKTKEMTVPASEFKISGTAVMIDTLVGADYNVEVTCTVYDSSDNILAYATDSVENYIGRNYQKNSLYGELLKYMMAAHSYFHH